MSDTLQLFVLSGATALIFGCLLLGVFANRYRRTHSNGSARFITASALSNLSRKIQHIAEPGVEVLMPAGAGLYPLTLNAKERAETEHDLEKWVTSGIQYTVIITSPNDEAVQYWQTLVDRLPSGLKVFLLDRAKAFEEDAIEIERLDRFHPVLILKGQKPLGMWLEAVHDPRSSIAYNVEYVASNDIVDFQRERFFRFLRVIRKLTDEGRRPPHLTRLLPAAAAITSTAA